jgi:LmbE family N-acetylglucosaminyl deacetylase
VSSLLVVGAHALDAEVMAGAVAAAAAARGWHVALLHLTRGERGHPDKPLDIFGEQLTREMAQAAQILGVDQEWPGIPAPLPPPEEIWSTIAMVIKRHRPDVLITHWRGSWHPSHVRAHEAVLAAVQNVTAPPGVLFAENCEDLTGFQASRFVLIDSVYDRWLEALNAYELFRLSLPESYSGGIPYWAYYTAAARVRGLQAELQLAQAFMPGPGTIPPDLGLRQLPGLPDSDAG